MSTSASSSTPSASDSNQTLPGKKRKFWSGCHKPPHEARTSPWLPISAFVGTSLAFAIPLFMLRRQRIGRNALRHSLKNSQTPPPPRRSNTTLTPQRSIPINPSASASPSTSRRGLGTTSEPSDISSPGMGEIISAISQMNQSTALLAAKAFVIATALVTVGGVTLTWAVKMTLGVEDAKDFGQKMRSMLQTTVPGLRSRLYRPPETDDERYQLEAQEDTPSVIDQDWNWEEAEERLKKAYEEGGISVWAQTALRELEAEATAERTKRDQEQEVA